MHQFAMKGFSTALGEVDLKRCAGQIPLGIGSLAFQQADFF